MTRVVATAVAPANAGPVARPGARIGLSMARLIQRLGCGLAAACLLAGPATNAPPAPLASSADSAQPRQAPDQHLAGIIDPQELEAFLDALVASQLNDYHIPGAAVAIVKDGGLLLAKGYGYADLERRRPVVAGETLFGPGSVAKLFTWTAVMQLVERGRLDLNAGVNIYLKDFQIPDTYPEPIALIHLMTHTAGFEDRHDFYVDDPRELQPLGDWLAQNVPARVRPPGTLTAYSNYGAALAGYIVEQVSGSPFEAYVEENILAPLDMRHSTFRQPVPPGLAANLAAGYTCAGGACRVEPFVYIQIPPAGSMVTTAADMARFMIAHLQDGRYGDARILQEATARQMRRQLFTNDPRVSGWAYGFMEFNLDDRRLLFHHGDTPLYHSLLALLPDHNLGLFIAYNGSGGSQALVPFLIAFLDHYDPAPLPRRPLPAVDSGAWRRLGRYTGYYRPTQSAYTTLEKARTFVRSQVAISANPDGTLLITGQGGSTRWAETAASVFGIVDAGQVIGDDLVFREDADGQITHFFWKNGPMTAYERVAWYETAAFQYALLALCIVLFLSAAILWLADTIRERRRLVTPVSGRASLRWARPLQAGAALLNLLFLIGLVITLSRPYLNARDLRLSMLPLLCAAWLISALAAGAAVFTVVAWLRRYGQLAWRVHYTLVTFAILAFVWWLQYWNLLGSQ